MRFKEFLKEDTVKTALNLDEPETGAKYDDEAVKKRIDLINKAIKELRAKSDMDDNAKEAMLADLNDKLDKWENVDKETAMPDPPPPKEQPQDGENGAPPEDDEEDKEKEEKDAEQAEKDAEEKEKDREEDELDREEQKVDREKRKAARKVRNAKQREKMMKKESRLIKTLIRKI